MRRQADGLADDDEKLDRGWRNFLATLLVDARNECGWLTEVLVSEEVAEGSRRDGFSRQRLLSAASHWRWVFWPGVSALSFDDACEELGLDPIAARNRIIDHCEPNRGINRLVELVLAWEPQ